VVASLLGASGSWGSSWAPRNTAKAAKLWVRHVDAAHTARRALGENRYLEVRYEDLHSDGVAVLQKVFRFLGPAVDVPMLEQFLSENSANSLRSGKGTPIPVGGAFGGAAGAYVREPDGFIGNATAGVWRQKLSPGQRAIVWWVAGRTMAELGISPARGGRDAHDPSRSQALSC
jgi:hypothetical protein